MPKDIQLTCRIWEDMVKYLQVKKEKRMDEIYKYKHSALGINYLYTLFNAGKNCIPDGCGSGSATVGQLEVLTLTYQLKLLSNLCNKVIAMECTCLILSFTVLFLWCNKKLQCVLSVRGDTVRDIKFWHCY